MTLGLWQQPATPLPFWVRPVRGETTMSYVFRLATANELVRPTTLLRSIGQPSNVQPHQFMLRDGFEVKLNAPAQQRLAVFAGIPLQRLARCLPLPAFLDGADDHGTPRLAMVGAGSQTRSHCTLCIARLPGTPPIKIYHGHAPVICPRHHRWLGIPPTPGQFDVSNTPEIITANRRRDRLLRSLHDQRWTATQFRAAEWVTIGWSGMVHLLWHRQLGERWKQRRASIATATGRTPPERLVLLPETAVLAEIFCDPQWRRQIAAASYYGQNAFYLHVAHRLGLPSGLATGVQVSADPLGYWVDRHKVHHRRTYRATWRPAIPAERTLDEFLRAAT
ncbi:TniQ family protein [Mycobacterium kansasii]